MPTRELDAFSARMPVIRAQEALHWSNIFGVGAGNIRKDDRDRILREWRRDSGATSNLRKEARRRARRARKHEQTGLPFRGIGTK